MYMYAVLVMVFSCTDDQSSSYHFSFHDEMAMTTHLALITDEDDEFEMMRTQLCLEGTASYDTINILAVCYSNVITATQIY